MSYLVSMKSARNVAYLVSQYPKVSHSFIRREILALEKHGWQIFRLAIRGWDLDLADPEDLVERNRTTFVLKNGPLSLSMAIIKQILRSPRRFFTAIRIATRINRSFDRPFIWHFFYLAEACWIAHELKKRNIRHIHAHFGRNDTEVAMLVGELANVSYSMTVHGLEEFDKTLIEKVRRAAFVVVVCSFGRAQLFRMVPYDEWDKIKIVHCGIDTTFADLDVVRPSDTNRLVCVGRLCPQKGQLLLVKSVATLIKEGRKLELVLVGDGEDRGVIEGLIAENNLAGFVTITGFASASRVKEEILSARALILPSFAEGLPVAIMEAMALGRPILSTHLAGIPELVIDGQTGWLFPAGSEEDMLHAIRACLDTPAEVLKVMGELARARALQRHNANHEAKKLGSLFETALMKEREQRCTQRLKKFLLWLLVASMTVSCGRLVAYRHHRNRTGCDPMSSCSTAAPTASSPNA